MDLLKTLMEMGLTRAEALDFIARQSRRGQEMLEPRFPDSDIDRSMMQDAMPRLKDEYPFDKGMKREGIGGEGIVLDEETGLTQPIFIPKEPRIRTSRMNQGGRVGFQTGGTTQQQQFAPDWIEALGKTYAADLTRQAGIPAITQATQQMPGETASQFAQRQAQAQQFDITQQSMGKLAPQVAGQDALQQAAYAQATDPTYGLGAYQPYTADARAAAQAAGALTGPMTTAQRTAYMSPYQQDVIDATMTEFDKQAQMRANEQAAAALGTPGAYGGGREGVQRAEYQTASDRNRAALLAQLNQQGFQQAQAARQQDFANQQALATQQAGLGTQAMGNVQRQIAGLGTLGATQQAQQQAQLDASRQFAQMAVQEPTTRLGMLGTGVTGLMGGTQGLGTTIGQAPPQTSPLGTALGIGSTLAGIYGYMNR